jgi:hypothetical protein
LNANTGRLRYSQWQSSQLDFVSHPSKLDVRIVAMSFGIC